VNIKEDNKNIQLLKEKLWSRRMTAEITMMERKITEEESDIIKEIRRNNTKEKEAVKLLVARTQRRCQEIHTMVF